jgi:CRP-like cAMP-binding protein
LARRIATISLLAFESRSGHPVLIPSHAPVGARSYPAALSERANGATAVHQLGENRLLLRLSSDELSQLKPLLKEVGLEPGMVLHRPGEPIDSVYFPTSGLVLGLARTDLERAQTLKDELARLDGNGPS